MNVMILLAALTVNFTEEIGPVRRELHSSGFAPTICSCPQESVDDIRSMGFAAARTHDWALINPALWRMNEEYFRYLLGECKKADVAPGGR